MHIKNTIIISCSVFILVSASGCTEEKEDLLAVFQDESTGKWVVEHPNSKRLWLRCAVGESWNIQTNQCTGSEAEMGYAEALMACPDGFSLPSTDDMATILCNLVEYTGDEFFRRYDSCAECSVCNRMFAGKEGGYYTSTTYEKENSDGLFSFIYNFYSGYVWSRNMNESQIASVLCIKNE